MREILLSRTSVGARVVYSPSPHGDKWSYWQSRRPSGALAKVGEWGWKDSDDPANHGCAIAAVAGGGTIAWARIPHSLDDTAKPACPASASTVVRYVNGPLTRLAVPGSWEPFAVDGTRIALARLDAAGRRTGELELFDENGNAVEFDQPDPPIIRRGVQAWLAPEGMVVRWPHRIWGVRRETAARAATVGHGRVIYVQGRSLRVRRIAGGPDRMLARLPAGDVLVAAGSLGVIVALDQGGGTIRLYRLPWPTVDQTLKA